MGRVRLFAGLALLVIAALAVYASYYLGGRVQTQYAALFSNQAVWAKRAHLRCEQLAYERGIFSSNATTRISPRGEDAPAVLLRHRIRHGPLLTGEDRLLGLARIQTVAELERDNSTTSLYTAFQTKTPLRATTFVALDRSVRSRITSPRDHWQSWDRKFFWGGLNGTVEILRGSRGGLELSFRLPRMEMDAPGRSGDVVVKGVRLLRSIRRDSKGGVINGTAAFHCSRFETGAEKWGSLRAESIALTSRMGKSDGLLWSESELGFRKGRFGEMDIRKADLGVRLENLDADVLEEWRSLVGRDDVSEKRIQELARRFLSGSPRMDEATLRMQSGEGEIRLDASAAFDGTGELSVPNRRQMLQRLQAESALSVPLSIGVRLATIPVRFMGGLTSGKDDSAQQSEELESRARVWLKKLRDLGYIAKDSGRYRLKLKLEKGLLSVGNKPVLPLGIFLQGQ